MQHNTNISDITQPTCSTIQGQPKKLHPLAFELLPLLNAL